MGQTEDETRQAVSAGLSQIAVLVDEAYSLSLALALMLATTLPCQSSDEIDTLNNLGYELYTIINEIKEILESDAHHH